MKKKYPFYLLFFISTLCFQSCEKNHVFEKNISIDKSAWNNSEKIKLEVGIQDTSAAYNLYINIRHASIYPYSNLWVMITTVSPDGNQLRQRLEIPLANEEGVWTGEGMGDIFDLKFLIQQNAIFNKTGNYTFEFEQIMRQNPLPGIIAIGLRVERILPIN